jgi:hypothetical protein
MKKYLQYFLALPFLFLVPNAFGQITLYSEDFSDVSLDDKGQDGATLDVSGVTNWTIDVAAAVTMSGGDHFKQTGGVFQSFNTDAPSGSAGVLWYSLVVDISCYTNVTVSTVLSRVSSNSGSGIQAHYILDGGAPVLFGSIISSGGTPVNASFSGLSGSTMQIRVRHFGTSSTPRYIHDDVSITGDYSTALCPIPASTPICGGYLTDSDAGTSAGTYANSINYTSTICPTTPGELTTVTFEGLDIGVGDVLNIYEGDDISGTSLGTVTAATATGFSVTSYDCITFNWITDATDNGNEGFWASILCAVPSTGNPPAADDFANAPLICDLGLYNGTTTGFTEDNPGNMTGLGGSCPVLFGGTLENNSWVKFVATSTSITIDFITTSCNGGFGSNGIQAAIFAYDGTNFTRLSNCAESDGQNLNFSLTASSLVIGDTYYIMTDGYQGSDCDFTLQATSGFTPMTVDASPTSVCSGDPSILTVSDATTTNLIWFADDPSFGSDYGSPLGVNPTLTTTYTVLAQGECAGTTADVTVAVNACASCAITNLTAGTQTACVPATNTYTQELTITYVNPPGSGTLDVNGQSFGITGSPQTVILTNLVSDGAAVNVTAVFSADGGCTMISNGLFIAPAACGVACTPDNGTWD